MITVLLDRADLRYREIIIERFHGSKGEAGYGKYHPGTAVGRSITGNPIEPGGPLIDARRTEKAMINWKRPVRAEADDLGYGGKGESTKPLHDITHAGSTSRQFAKVQIEHDLADRLKNDPDWREYTDRHVDSVMAHLKSEEGKFSSDAFPSFRVDRGEWNRADEAGKRELVREGLHRNEVREAVHLWATTSMDSHPMAIAMQLAVEREFHTVSPRWKDMIDRPKVADAEAVYSLNGKAYRAFARAQYENTQAFFQEHGITRVTAFRGMDLEEGKGFGGSRGIGRGGVERVIRQQPASSWSVRPKVARDFSGGLSNNPGKIAVVLHAHIPVERIMATARTGVGCLSEGEIVVLGSHGKARVYAANDRARGYNQRERRIQQRIKRETSEMNRLIARSPRGLKNGVFKEPWFQQSLSLMPHEKKLGLVKHLIQEYHNGWRPKPPTD